MEHIWSVLNDPSLSFPAKEIVAAWRKLPAPAGRNDPLPEEVRVQCRDVYKLLRDWQSTLAADSSNDEEAPVLTENSFEPSLKHSFRAVLSWPKGATNMVVEISAVPVNGKDEKKPAVAWRQPRVRFRQPGSGGADLKGQAQARPLKEIVSQAIAQRLRFGKNFNGDGIDAGDFVTSGSVVLPIEFPIPAGATRAEFLVDVQLDLEHGDDCLVRCVIASEVGEGATAAATGAISALLANPNGAGIDSWKAGVREFARKLPQVSHREAAPSDRDPIVAGQLPSRQGYPQCRRGAVHVVRTMSPSYGGSEPSIARQSDAHAQTEGGTR